MSRSSEKIGSPLENLQPILYFSLSMSLDRWLFILCSSLYSSIYSNRFPIIIPFPSSCSLEVENWWEHIKIATVIENGMKHQLKLVFGHILKKRMKHWLKMLLPHKLGASLFCCRWDVDEVWYHGYHVSWPRQKWTGAYHESAHSA
jgi:hypothetical protein